MAQQEHPTAILALSKVLERVDLAGHTFAFAALFDVDCLSRTCKQLYARFIQLQENERFLRAVHNDRDVVMTDVRIVAVDPLYNQAAVTTRQAEALLEFHIASRGHYAMQPIVID
jgi:hypothetical protein